jgi:hypothetical protein
VAAVFLGTNYGGDIAAFTSELDEILGRLAPRPTLLYTVTEFKPNRADVNEAIRSMLAYYPNVQVIDWATITDADPTLLGADGYHLSPAGISRLVFETALALGGAPTGEGGDCLSSRFTDDSAGDLTNGGGGTPTTTGGTRPRATTTTVRATTTIPQVGSTTTGPPTSNTTTTQLASPTTTLPAVPVTTIPLTQPTVTVPPPDPTTPPDEG